MNVLEEFKRSRQVLFDTFQISPESKTVSLTEPISQVHYLELGAGSPLILIHGGGSNSSEWLNILKPLSEHYHLYVVDRPGCGFSDPFNYKGVDLPGHAQDFIASFLNAVGLEKASFLGQSMGGYFSLCFAMQYPERVTKICLIGAPAGMNKWIPFMLRLLGTKGLNRMLLQTLAKPSIDNVKKIHRELLVANTRKLSDAYLEHVYYAQLLPTWAPGFRTLLENVLTLRGWRKKYYIGDQLDRLKVPVRFIWGDKDAFESPESGLKKASKIKDLKFKVVSDAGHCPWLDKPHECKALILSSLME